MSGVLVDLNDYEEKGYRKEGRQHDKSEVDKREFRVAFKPFKFVCSTWEASLI